MDTNDKLDSIAIFWTVFPPILCLIVFPIFFELGYYSFAICVALITVYSFAVQRYSSKLVKLNLTRPYWARIHNTYPVIIFCVSVIATALWAEHKKWSFFSFVVIGSVYWITRNYVAEKFINWLDDNGGLGNE